MARQIFTKGQTVYCHSWSGMYRKAVVARPDFTKPSFSSGAGRPRDIHYVGVIYTNRQGEADGDEWPVLNNSRLIITGEKYNEFKQAKNASDHRRDIRAYTAFEANFLMYFEQAEIICRAVLDGRNAEPSEVNELAHYLRGTFAFSGRYDRMDREGVRTARHEKRCKAADARAALLAMGEDAPELVKEAGA